MKRVGRIYREYLPYVALGAAPATLKAIYMDPKEHVAITASACALVLAWPVTLPIVFVGGTYSFVTGKDVYARFRLQWGTRETKTSSNSLHEKNT